MSRELVTFADAVLPLIRSTSRDRRRYAAANQQAARMHEGIELPELAFDESGTLPSHGIRAPSPQP